MTSTETKRNFDDFNNMFKGIHCKDDCVNYTAVLIVDKVKLERNPIRSYDVDLWYGEIFYGRIDMLPISDNARNSHDYGIAYNSDVGDIED